MDAPDARRERARRIRDAAAIFAVGTIVFAACPAPEFTGLDARFALFAQHMLRTGPTFFPIGHLGAYPDYPSTTILPIYGLSLLCGKVTPFVAVLPTALVSVGVLVLTYLIGAIRSRRWGASAACLAGLTFTFVQSARSISPDQYTSLVTAGCFYLAYSASVSGRRRRQWAIPLLFLAGFACRGPIGLIVPTGVICAWYVCERDYKRLLLTGATGLVLLLAGCGAFWLAAEHQGGLAFAKRVVFMQAAGRVGGGGDSLLHYWISSLGDYAAAFPLAVLVVVLQWRKMVARQDDDHRLLAVAAAWVIIVTVGLSFSASQKGRYLLPITPALALIAAYLFAETEQRRAASWVRSALRRVCLAVPFVVAAGGWTMVWMGPPRVVDRTACAIAAAVSTILAAVVLVCLRWRRGHEAFDSLFALSVGALGFVASVAGLLEPLRFARNSSAQLVRYVNQEEALAPRPVVFYDIGPDVEDNVLAANYGKPIAMQFIESPARLSGIDPAALCIIKERDLGDLPPEIRDRMHVLLRAPLVGKACVVFTLDPPSTGAAPALSAPSGRELRP